MKTIPAHELTNWVGRQLPPSEWFEIDQQRVDRFARATEDFQFIHVDAERAKQTPMGVTIAHGFLTLSLLTHLCTEQTVKPEGVDIIFNYGSDKVRYLNPVKVGSRIRAHSKLKSAEEKGPGRWLVKNEITVEIEGEQKPALVAEILTMFVLGSAD